MRSEPCGDVILVPCEDADGLADGDKVQAKLHLAAEPDVIPDDAIFGRVGATFPDLSAKKERAGLDGHMPVGIDGVGNGDLVEEVEEVELSIQHNGGSEDGVGLRLLKFLKGLG